MPQKGQIKYKVGIPKEYFPHGTCPARFTGTYEVVSIFAKNRTAAAMKAWKIHGVRWERLMRKDVKIVSLYVNDPKVGASGLMGRLSTIIVKEFRKRGQ